MLLILALEHFQTYLQNYTRLIQTSSLTSCIVNYLVNFSHKSQNNFAKISNMMMSSPLKCFLWLPGALSINPTGQVSRALLFTLHWASVKRWLLDAAQALYSDWNFFLPFSSASSCTLLRSHVRNHFLQKIFYEPQDCTA